MKKIIMLSLGLAVFANAAELKAGNFTDLNTQKKTSTTDNDGVKGKVMINAGIGLNLIGASLQVKYTLSSYWTNRSYESMRSRQSPMFNIGVDYGLAPKFSAGVAFGYQTAKLIMSEYDYNYNPNGNGDLITYTDSWKRIHFAVKGDYHIIAKDNISLYTGIKIGYNIYSMTSTITPYEPSYVSQLNVQPSPISLQAHFGLNYYFNAMVGFNAEIGIGYGGPYIFAAGLAVKI